MAKGSEQLTWELVGGKRPCDGCGVKLKISEVRVHTTVPNLAVFCDQCFKDGKWL
jgi:hypothetical protein